MTANTDLFIEMAAEAFIEFGSKIENMLKLVPSDDLRTLLREIDSSPDRNGIVESTLTRKIRLELGFRLARIQAQELGCACFCVYHNCCSGMCPPGEHE